MSCKASYHENLLANTGSGLADMAYNTYGRMPYFFAKAGNIASLYTIANHAVNGDTKAMNEASVSFIGGWAAGVVAAKGAGVALAWAGAATLASGGVLAITVPAILSVIAGTYISYKIDSYYAEKNCKEPDTSPYRPHQDESPTQYYKKEYYDPIILDLDGNGVGTVAKFGYRGAMFDHDGDGIATQAGWVAVNDELWEMVV